MCSDVTSRGSLTGLTRALRKIHEKRLDSVDRNKISNIKNVIFMEKNLL